MKNISVHLVFLFLNLKKDQHIKGKSALCSVELNIQSDFPRNLSKISGLKAIS